MTSIPSSSDLVLLFTALHAACDADVTLRTASAGFPELRPAHGYVFQHLIVGPKTVTELARRLGMTVQGASKLVIELERLGYVSRDPDTDDHRNRNVTLTPRGWAAIEAGREARAAVTAELCGVLGEEDANRLLASLQRLAEQTGGLSELLARRLKPSHR
jgi:DNA-binding MarR family transcriptional regulator